MLLLAGPLICVPATYGQEALAQARQELQAGRTDYALQILESYRLRHPEVPRVYNLLGMAYAQQGKTDQALAMFKKFVQLAPDLPEAYNNLGATYLRRGELDEAERSFRRALTLRPNDPSALYNVGALLNTRHDYSSAIEYLVRARRVDRSHAVSYELAAAYAGSSDPQKALDILSSMAPPSGAEGVPWLQLQGTLYLQEGRLKEGAGVLQRALASAPTDPLILYSLGLAQLKLGQPSEAVPLLEKSFASASPAKRYFKVAALLAQEGANSEAIAELERAAAEDPKHFDTFYNLAVLHLRRKEINSADQAAEHALALRPSAEVHNLLGDIREAQGRFGEALEEYQQAARGDPGNPKFAFDVGIELILHGNYREALEVFRAAQERFPDSVRIALGVGAAEYMAGSTQNAVKGFLAAARLGPYYEPVYTFLGESYTFAGEQAPQVLAELSTIARRHPKSFAAQYYLGKSLVEEAIHTAVLTNLDNATEALKRAAVFRPDDGMPYYYLGEIERLRGHLNEASAFYAKSWRLNPNFPDALYKLGQTYVRLGKKDEAAEILARHREVETSERERLENRSKEIRMFVLALRTRE